MIALVAVRRGRRFGVPAMAAWGALYGGYIGWVSLAA